MLLVSSNGSSHSQPSTRKHQQSHVTAGRKAALHPASGPPSDAGAITSGQFCRSAALPLRINISHPQGLGAAFPQPIISRETGLSKDIHRFFLFTHCLMPVDGLWVGVSPGCHRNSWGGPAPPRTRSRPPGRSARRPRWPRRTPT